jgi:PAS domain S-box-containing protein/TyrR family helix-turn-helix protein
MNAKLKVSFKDRIGIVADISRLIARHGMNIASMEVIRKHDEAHVYVEVESGKSAVDQKALFSFLSTIEDIINIDLIHMLPMEEQANRLRVVLDNISDGVISVDKSGTITTMNTVAGSAFGLTADDVVGKNLNQLDLPGYTLLKCLEGEKIIDVKQNLITANRRYQYISTCKPIHNASGDIVGAVEIAKDIQGIKRLARSISDPRKVSFSDIIGNNATIKEAITFAQKIADNDAAVSIRGASGTGKELFARAIHAASNRTGPFIPINCAALPEQLLESELFGYARGAFTGGIREGKPGLFEIAQNGTVFLDEIAEMPLGSQAKLLRLIQEKAVRRVGGSQEIHINARLITATNKNLERLVEEKAFRQDLYYRINVLPIHIPPLKQRPEDISVLAEHFLFQLGSKLEKPVPGLDEDALGKLRSHDWPGNVRELKNVVNRAAIICERDAIDRGCIFFSHELAQGMVKGSGTSDLSGRTLREQVAELERRILLDTLKSTKSIRQAARRLQISHPALLKKMRKYHIQRTVKVIAGSSV